MDDLHTDGNGVAGLLAEVFVTEATVLVRRCRSCGDARALGEHRAYHGAGVVLRCPSCGAVALRVAVADEALTVEWRGTFRVEAAPPASG